MNLALPRPDPCATGADNQVVDLPLSVKAARSWPFALALSLCFHVSLALPLFFLSARSQLGESGGSLVIDTRAAAPAMEVDLVLLERSQPSLPLSQPTRTVAAMTPSATPQIPVPDEGFPTSLPRQASPDYEPYLEQEAPTARRTPVSGPGSGSADPGIRKETTAFFQIATQGKAIVYVIDRSGSMGSDGCLATAKRELLDSLAQLPSFARFQVIAYNRSAEPLRINGQSGLSLATPENKRCVARLLEEIHAEGGTDHLAALKRALALGPDVIFFLTDADDLRPDQVRSITSMNHGRSVIHAIGLGHAGGVLPALAQDNQGLHQWVPLEPR